MIGFFRLSSVPWTLLPEQRDLPVYWFPRSSVGTHTGVGTNRPACILTQKRGRKKRPQAFLYYNSAHKNSVWRFHMKNITLSADEKLIEAARRRAASEHTTLNQQFRIWLEEYARRKQQADDAREVIRELQDKYSTGGRKFTRDEMNER